MKDLNNEHLKSLEKDWKGKQKMDTCSAFLLHSEVREWEQPRDFSWCLDNEVVHMHEGITFTHSPVKRNHDICRHRTRDYIESVSGTQKDKCHVFSLNSSFELQILIRKDITWSNHRKVKMDHGRLMKENRIWKKKWGKGGKTIQQKREGERKNDIRILEKWISNHYFYLPKFTYNT